MGCYKGSSIRSFGSAVALFFAFFLLSSESLNAALISDTLREHQVVRDNLFNTLSAEATNYTFKYVVIVLPAGTIPGKDFPIPVSHIRYESTVFFGFNESTLQPNAEPILRDFAKVILKDTALRSLLIVGHTDSIGDDAYNVNLIQKARFYCCSNSSSVRRDWEIYPYHSDGKTAAFCDKQHS